LVRTAVGDPSFAPPRLRGGGGGGKKGRNSAHVAMSSPDGLGLPRMSGVKKGGKKKGEKRKKKEPVEISALFSHFPHSGAVLGEDEKGRTVFRFLLEDF